MSKRFTKETIKELPVEVQEEVMEVLRVYDHTNIMKVNGEWDITPNVSIVAWERDIEDYGEAYQEDFYNEEERREIINKLNQCEWWD